MKVAFDLELMRPGCALLQAALGAGTSIAQHFPVESWLLFPTPGLKVYELTDEQLPKLVEMVVLGR
jgi:hypothetical protein